jgi:O-antigen/teichoic acid export membrane protein
MLPPLPTPDDPSSTPDPLPAAELQRRAISGSTWTAIHTFVSLPIAFVANAIVARSLAVQGYGHLAFLTAILGLAFTFANFGVAGAVIQMGSRAEAGGRRREADDLLRRSLGFHTVIELPILLAVALALTRNDPWWETAALGTAVISTCVLGGTSLSITIENRTAAGARLAIPVNLVLQGASVLAAVLIGSASAVWVVRALVPALALGLNFLLLDPRRRRTVLQPRLPFALGRKFWRYSLLTWVSGLLAVLVYSRSELFLLQLFHQTAALGFFALAFGLGVMITAPADAMLHALLPAVSGIIAVWPERALQTFERSTRVSALVCGGIAAVVVPSLVVAVPLIYGQNFARAAWLFAPLALVSTFQSVNNPVLAFVNGRQRGGLILKANAAALAVDLVVAVALIPEFGAWGAVAANISGQTVALTWLAKTEPLVMARGVSGLVRLYRAFLFGATIGAAALAADAALGPSLGVLGILSTCAISFAAYVLVLRRTGSGLTIDDRNALVGAAASPMRPYMAWLLRPVTNPNML